MTSSEEKAENRAFWEAYNDVASGPGAPFTESAMERSSERFSRVDGLPAKVKFYLNRDGRAAVYLLLDNEADWKKLAADSEAFERVVGRVLDWMPSGLKPRHAISAAFEVDPTDRDAWPRLHRNMAYAAIRLVEALQIYSLP